MVDLSGITQRLAIVRGVLDERSRRLVAAAESVAIGRGGVSAVARATGMSRQVIRQGMRELTEVGVHPPGRIRRPGGGRKRAVAQDPSLLRDLEGLVEPVTRGDPESPLRWTCKSLRKLAEELRRQGHQISHQLVARMLHDLGYSLQANSKTLEGTDHPDRNAQFEYLNRKVKRQLQQHQPVISVDTKKKELVGNFKNNGRELRPQGDPEKVRVHDFIIPELGRANPYGVYDIAHNTGWVSVGVDHDTAAVAVESIRRWWNSMGQAVYPHATRLLITADSGGSNGVACGFGKWNYRGWPTKPDCGLRSVICHREPASGIRSSTACSPSSARTGAASHSSVTR